MKPEERVEAVRYPLAACLLVAVFIGGIFNRFLPVQDAWFAHYGELMRAGRLPYRDFYCFIQPLPLVLARLIVAVGGDHLIWFRIYAFIERIALTFVLYDMLRQCFSRYAAFVGAMVSVVVMTTSVDDALFGYVITCLLFSSAAMSALARAFRFRRGAWFVWCGVFLALAFFTKQSTGGVLGAALFCVIVWAAGDAGAVWRALMKVGAGFAIVGLVVAAGLFIPGLMSDYLHDVFFNALGQKGGASNILTGFWSRLDITPYLIAVMIAAAVLVTCRLAGWLRPWADSGQRRLLLVATALLFLVGIMVPVEGNEDVLLGFIASRVYLEVLFAVPLTFYATLALLVYLLAHPRQLREARASCNPGLLVLAAGSMAGMVASGMSYEVTAGSLAPAIGVCLAYGFDLMAGRRVVRVLLIMLAGSLVLVGATKKYLTSYWWWGWEDTCLHAPSHSRLPQLAGFNLNPDELAIYERVVDLIQQNAGRGDNVFTFPNIPMFNVLTGHLQPTFAPVHFLDVCPDAVQRQDIATLRRDPPRIIVWLRAPEARDAWLERAFRGGRPNGYEDMESTLQQLTGSPRYVLLYRVLHNSQSFPLEVWLRR